MPDKPEPLRRPLILASTSRYRAALLDRFGHRLLQADGGLEAIERFEIESPDLVLCDLAMPGVDGMDVLSAIRAHPSRGDTPIILVTAYAERELGLPDGSLS